MVKHVKVGAIRYRVEYVESLPDMGECDEMAATIRIRQGLATDIERVTLIHEVLHAALFALGHRKHSELIVDGLAYQLVQILRDNPGLIDK